MNRTRDYRRKMRVRKINQRKNKILDLLSYRSSIGSKFEDTIYGDNKNGYLSKCHYGYLSYGKKTKAKNGYQTHRHKGEYGKAIRYSRHDGSKILGMQIEEKQYYNNEL